MRASSGVSRRFMKPRWPVLGVLLGWSSVVWAQAPGFLLETLEPGVTPPRARHVAAPQLHQEKLAAGASMAAVSADGKTVAVGERQRLRVVTPGGAERVLRQGRALTYHGLDVSADGALVHHRDGDGRAWLYDARSGRALLEVEATRSTLTPAGELLWWEDNGALAQEAAAARDTFAPRAAARPLQARPGSCQLNRRRADGGVQRLWFPACRDIVMVAADGSFAVIGAGGAAQRLDTSTGGTLPQDTFDALTRVDLRSGARAALGGAGLLRPQLSGDGRTACGTPYEAFVVGRRELVRCQRDGGPPLELSVPLDGAPALRWTLLSLSQDGRWLAVGASSEEAGAARHAMHVLPIASGARPVFSAPGQMLSWVWLPGSHRVALSLEQAETADAYLVDPAQGWSARLGEQGRAENIVGLRPVGERADEVLMVRTRGADVAGADVWRARVLPAR